MFPAYRYKLKHQHSLYQTVLTENVSVHVVVLNKYDLNDDISINQLHCILSPLYTINNLIKDTIKYLKKFHNESYHVWCLDYDDKSKHKHFHYTFNEWKKISNESIMDNDRHLIKEHLTLKFKVYCKIKVPIKILNHKKEKVIEIMAPYSNKYCIKQLINDTKKHIHRIYKNKMYIHSIEMIQNLKSLETEGFELPTSWNTPLLFHKINNETNELQSLQLKITLKHRNRKKIRYKKPTKFDQCLYLCF